MKTLLLLATLLLFTPSIRAADLDDTLKPLYEEFTALDKAQKWSQQANMLLSDDLQSFKELLIKAYETAKAKVKKDGSVSSLAFTTFKSKEALDGLSPEDVYIAIREKTVMPPEMAAKMPPIVYERARQEGSTVWIDVSTVSPASNKPIHASLEMVKKEGKWFFRLPQMITQSVEAEIENNKTNG